MDNDIEESSGSDFDDDEDPDKIQVPGKLGFATLITRLHRFLFSKVAVRIWRPPPVLSRNPMLK